MKTFRVVDGVLALERALARRPGPARGVLLLSCGGLGDTVLFAHVLDRFLPLASGDETVTVLLRRDAAKMAFLFPKGVEVRTVDFARLPRDPRYRWNTCRELFHGNYRLVVATDHLRHPFLDEALVAACAAPEAVAMEPRPWPKHDARLTRNRSLYTRLFASGPLLLDKVVRWSRFAAWLTGRDSPPPVARLAPESLSAPADPASPSVLAQPFSAVVAKQYPPALYRRIREALPRETRLVITGAPGDLERNPDYRELLELPGVSFDSSTFQDLVPLLRAARLVVSVDTALMHLAVAVGAPTLCLASAAYVGEIVPYAPEITPDNAHFLYRPMDCQGCLGACSLPLERTMYPCVARLDPEQVTARVMDLLRTSP